MKKITFLFALLLTISISFGQNLITNGDFETGETTPWDGYKNQVLTDDLTSSQVGNINNGDGSFSQVFTVTPEASYDVSFDYRWVGSGGTAMAVRVKDGATGGDNLGTFNLNTTVDTWFSDGSFSFTAPAGTTTARVIFYKTGGNRPLRIDNVSITLKTTASVTDNLSKFNFNSFPNPAQNYLDLSASKNIDKIKIYNLLGKEIINKNLNNTTAKVDISSLAKGAYLLKVSIENTVGTYKFIKK